MQQHTSITLQDQTRITDYHTSIISNFVYITSFLMSYQHVFIFRTRLSHTIQIIQRVPIEIAKKFDVGILVEIFILRASEPKKVI